MPSRPYVTDHFRRGKRVPILLVLATVIGWSPVDATQPAAASEPGVRIEALSKTAAEGESGNFRIHRNSDTGDLQVHLRLSGDAVPGRDYHVAEEVSVEAGTLTVTIPDGKHFADLVLQITDDVAAEPDETIRLTVVAEAGDWKPAADTEAAMTIPRNDFVVTHTGDAGEGSLRQAILNAHALPGAHLISFDPATGAHEAPQTITLASALPELRGELTIDARSTAKLWSASGVTVSGAGRLPVFVIGVGGRVTLNALTIADGYAGLGGGGVLNLGELVVKDSTLVDNVTEQCGGALLNLGGRVEVVNSTFFGNRAGEAGGGLCNLEGTAMVTNNTFSENAATEGGALFSSGPLLLRNSLLANSPEGKDCVNRGVLDAASTHNLIESNDGCGTPVSSADPQLGSLGYYNGPARTLPVSSGSPAVNLGDNASALDEQGQPLVWDQRGNGDPRFVGGITDIGAFELQAFPVLLVDIAEDSELRACSRVFPGDCSLRGAIHLANAGGKPARIGFDPRVFSAPQTIELGSSLPAASVDIEIDGADAGGVTVSGMHRFRVFHPVKDVRLTLSGVKVVDEVQGQ